jgi:protease II
MDVRVVRCLAGENILQTIINDVYSHGEDDEYATRFIGANIEAKNHYVVRCETFQDISKERDTIYRHIGEALRRAHGGVPQTDTPYVVLKVPADE